MEPEEVFFTPDNEAYLGMGPLQLFDEGLISAFATCRTLALAKVILDRLNEQSST